MKVAFLAIILLFPLLGMSQRIENKLVLNGTVFGYTYNNTKSIFKKDKKIDLEGSLTNVELKLKDSKGALVETTQSSAGGEFTFSIPLQDEYTIIYSKDGYGTSAFDIDLKSIPDEVKEWGVVLKNVEIILNNYESDKPQDNGEPFGVIQYSQSKERFGFKVYEVPQRKRLFKKTEENTSVNLMKLSLDKNAALNIYSDRDESITPSSPSSNSSAAVPEDDNATSPFSENYKTAQQKISALEELGVNNAEIDAQGIAALGDKIKAERALLEQDRLNAVTEIDFLNIAAREKLLASAERELSNAERYIAEQDLKLGAQQKFIYAVVGVLLLFIALAVLLWLAYRQKQKNNKVLAAKNKKIQDSINYALKIQRSVLLTDSQIKEILPHSFVYYQPLDGVSGDFYWFSKIKNKTILAAVDCTGHGVPGAFMSLIGNTLMNQIVNQDGIIKPAEILKALHTGIVESLHQTQNDEAAQDGMDISVCCLDHDTNTLTMAGAMNAVYLLQGGEIKTLRASLRTIGGYVRKGKAGVFKEEEIAVNKGDRIYMFSDGFMDQFGGVNDDKYNITRFKELILNLKEVAVEKQEKEFEKAHLNWKGTSSQTDDILVVGAEV